MSAIRVATFAGPGVPPVIREVPRPEVPPRGALIQIGACGVCGTDLHILKGHWPKPLPWLSAALGAIRAGHRPLEFGPEELKVDRRAQPLEAVAFRRQSCQPLFEVEKASLPAHPSSPRPEPRNQIGQEKARFLEVSSCLDKAKHSHFTQHLQQHKLAMTKYLIHLYVDAVGVSLLRTWYSVLR